MLQFCRPGLIHAVSVRGEWEAEWSQLDTAGLSPDQMDIRLPVRGLATPFSNYTLRISMLSGKADRLDARLWSDVVSVTARTQPSRPFRYISRLEGVAGHKIYGAFLRYGPIKMHLS